MVTARCADNIGAGQAEAVEAGDVDVGFIGLDGMDEGTPRKSSCRSW